MKPTDEFVFEKITLENISDYLGLIDSIRYICEYSGFDPNFDIVEEFKNPDLPKDGRTENNIVLGVKRSNSLKPCVWIQYYKYFLNEPTVFLGEFFVDKREQGFGIGRAVYQRIEADWKKLGFTKAVLNVDLKNTAAILFWIKIGFKTIDSAFDTGTGGEGKYYMLRLSKEI